MRQKRGVFFSIDAVIALMLIVTLVGAGYLVIRHTENTAELHYDVLNTLGAVKIGEVSSPYIQSLISSGEIKDTNTSALEVIGRYYVTNKTRAGEIASVFLDRIETKENIGIWYGSTLIASNNATPYEEAHQIDTVRQFVTGIQEGESVTGFSARSFLSSRAQTKYIYIGGYVGDGNLTLTAEYYGNLTKATLELAAGENYTLYVNGVYAGTYDESTTIEQPRNFTISPSLFHTGSNTIEFRGSQVYIAGGMLKLSYEGDVDYTQLPKQYIPGVKGIVNIYDGLSIPSTLKQMSISLHYNSTQPVKMLIGNVTVFNSSSSGETTVVLSNTQLAALLDYDALSNTTTPVRVWIENTSFTGIQQEFDVVLITDVSGSMDWRLDSDTSGTARNCDSASLTASSTKRISLAKCLDKDFAQTIINSSTLSRVGLVSFSNNADSYVDLTRNFTLLNNTISAYSPSGATCVSCAINRAHTILQAQSNSSRMKFIVVMTDGVTNRRSTNTCTDLTGIGALTNSMAVGSLGVIVNKTATQWNNITSPTSNNLLDIDMLNDTAGFAVGESGTILRWNGTLWINQTSPVSNTLHRVDWFNNTFALAVGASGRVLRWNGTSWSTAATISNTPTLYGVSIFNTTHALAVGSYSNRARIYRSTNGGTTWTLDYSGSSNTNLEGVDVANTTSAYAVGDDGLIVRFSGSSWSTQSSPTSQNLYAIEAKNSTHIEALGGDAGQSIIIRTTGGSSWSSVYSTQEDILHDLIHLNGSAYAVGEGGLIVEYTTVWNRTFTFPLAYEGVSSSGVSCTLDGDACTETNSFAALNANYSSCRTRTLINTTVYSVGFGPISTCGFALRTMQSIASCGNGTFYASSNASTLQQIYSTIAQDIVQIAYSTQSSQPSSGFTSQIFSDSYIETNYTTPSTPFGLKLSTETSFLNTTNAQFTVPPSVTVTEARVTSYSGARWTQLIKLNNVVAYNLTRYGQTYLSLGDPFVVTLPTSVLNTSNTLTLTTAATPTNISGGSVYNKVIQTFVKNATGYSPIAARAAGCIWTIDFEDNTNLTINIPSNYAGTDTCRYQTSSLVYDSNDAAQAAAYNLLAALDLDSDLKVDLTLTPSDIEIELSELTGIPYTWATEVQIRVWR